MVSGLCKLHLEQFTFLYIQTLHNDCLHIEDVPLQFCAHLINIFSILMGVELRHIFHLKMHRGCLVCVICNLLTVLFLYIQTLHNDCSHIEGVHP